MMIGLIYHQNPFFELRWLHKSAEAPTPTKNKDELNVMNADWSQITVGQQHSAVNKKSCGVFLCCVRAEVQTDDRWVGTSPQRCLFLSGGSRSWRCHPGCRFDDSAGLLSAAELLLDQQTRSGRSQRSSDGQMLGTDAAVFVLCVHVTPSEMFVSRKKLLWFLGCCL